MDSKTNTVQSSTMTWTVSDSSRVDPNYGGFRMMTLKMWYPTEFETISDQERSPYINHSEKLSGGSWFTNLIKKDLKTFSSQKRDIIKGKFPLILFSPSLGGNLHYYTYYAEYLARKGHIVVGMNHRYESAYIFNNNKPEYSNLTFHDDLKQLAIPDEITADDYRRKKDIRQNILGEDMLFVLDNMLSSAFTGSIDETKIGVFGHSIGGAASVYAAFKDSRIKAVVNFDGTPPTIALENGIDQPFLFLEDLTDYKNHSGYKKLHKLRNDFCMKNRSNSYRILYKGFNHNTFLDTSLMLSESENEYNDIEKNLRNVTEAMALFYKGIFSDETAFDLTSNQDFEVHAFLKN